MQHVLFFAGGIDKTALKRALDEMIRRHEVLRTTFRSVDGQPVQIIHPPRDVALPLINLSEHSEEIRDRELQRLLNRELQQGFDLESGPLYNFVLVQLDSPQYALSICVHHIVFDDWSVEVFDREFMTCYEDLKAGRAVSLPEVALQYAAFSAAQRIRFDRDNLDTQLAYWRSRLRNLPPDMELPIDKPRPAIQTFNGAIRTFALPSDVARDFRALTRGANATLFMSLFAAFAVLLHRYTGAGDLVLGTPMANRNRPEVANLIGFMVNTLVLRIDVSDDPSFKELLVRARDMAVGAFANQDVPFELLVEDLRPDREANKQPIFQTMFVFQSGLGGKDSGGSKDLPSSGAKFDLVLTAIDAAPYVCGEFEYNTDLFTQPTMARMASQFETLIASIVADPDRRISELALLSGSERKKILTDWNRTAAPIPTHCVHEIVGQFAAATPNATALTFGDLSLSFGDLAHRSDILASRIRSLGIGPEVRVGMCLDRTPDWVVSMLAIMKAGGVMVPLDPALPTERLAFMIADAEVQLVLTTSARVTKLDLSAVASICLDEPHIVPESAAAAPESGQPVLAYIIYTSGSTGRPKGVLVEHRGLTNLALAQGRFWNVGPTSRVLQFAAAGFDAAMSEVFSTLCLGGTLCLAPPEALMPGASLLETLREGRISHVTLPPSALAAMQPQSLPDLRVVISAGEHCDPSLARRWAQGRRMVNAYGPTEITVCATMHDYVEGAPDVPIGRPIANTQVYVLDHKNEPVPPGVSGEIHVGGIGVARGYINRPELTAERFIPDPFSGRPGARLYKTGDLGRFDASGTLHYLSRIDNQLKIRGYRIEPGEIESVLRLHPQVNDALVLGHGHGSDARLIAFVIPKDPPPLVIELRGFVARQLPDYMSPAAFVMVAAWPKTPNGKIDRAALPRPDSFARDVGAAYVAPVNDLEQTISAIWRDVLGVDQVGVTDNFFDLGGHSLLLVRVHDQLKEKLKVDLSLVDLFRFPTVKRQAEMLEAKSASRVETETLGRTDQRAARQNAARLQRRIRTGADRHA